MEEISLITSLAIVLGVALIAGMAARLLRLPVIVGYLLSGLVIGPFGFGLVPEMEEVETLATIGVVLLMFTLGIEFSLRTLRQMGKIAVLGGALQIAVTIGLGVLVGWLLGWSMREAVVFGLMISLSSTIIVLKTLMDRGELGSAHGRVMIGILLVQDLSVVPMMVFLTSWGEADAATAGALGWTVFKALIFLVGIAGLGLWVLPRVIKRVAGAGSRELFLLAVICIVFGAAYGAHYVGLSIALGAFLAGLLVSQSEFAHQALADIRPLRDLFAIIFFVSLGMLADLDFIVANPGEVAAVVAAIVLGKFVITGLIPRVFGHGLKTCLFVGSGLFQIGEFSFVLAAIALELNAISDDLYSLTLAAALITILLTPFSMGLISRLYYGLTQADRVSKLAAAGADEESGDGSGQLTNHAVICGYGETASSLVQVMDRRHFSYLVIDIDPRALDRAREKGITCIYGDASNPDILARAQLGRARVLIIAFPDPVAARLAVLNARAINPRLDIVARAHRDEDLEVLRGLGVGEVVRPQREAGLEIIRHTLHRFGLTNQEILYIVNTLREEEA